MTSATQHNVILEDNVIAVMGMTRSGKSSFLNLVRNLESETANKDIFKVGQDLKFETADIQGFQFFYEDGVERNLCLLDMPEFDDTDRLQTISTALLQRPNIIGIIYFHNINEPLLAHSARQATKIFCDICGRDAMKNVVLCTSQWEKLKDKTESERRESQLHGEYWKKMIDEGARPVRHNNTLDSARQILKHILRNDPVTPKLVTELKMRGLTLKDTPAGRAVSAAEARQEWAETASKILAQLQGGIAAITAGGKKVEMLQVAGARLQEMAEGEQWKAEGEQWKAEDKQREAENKQREAEEKQREAEEKQREAEKKQLEAEAKQLEAEEKQREAEEKQREAKKKQREAEAKQRDAEKKQRDAEAKQRDAEKKQREAEVKQREAEGEQWKAEEKQRDAEQRRAQRKSSILLLLEEGRMAITAATNETEGLQAGDKAGVLKEKPVDEMEVRPKEEYKTTPASLKEKKPVDVVLRLDDKRKKEAFLHRLVASLRHRRQRDKRGIPHSK